METIAKPIILASASPRRKELLTSLGLTFEVEASSIDEHIPAMITPQEAVETLAKRKAEAVARHRKHGLVLGSDTLVVLDGEPLGKPRDEEEAFLMLNRLQGRTHLVYTGVALVDLESKQWKVGHEVTKVTMAPLSEVEIRKYIATKEPLDKAGAYAIQGLGATFVEKIEGDYFTVVGLPLRLTAQFLKAFGVDVLERCQGGC